MPAQGQGTMNNLTLGNDAFTYYETLGGGQGACPDADGPSAVHVAMSNTLNTPVEALEQEFPLRVTRVLAAPRARAGQGATAAATASCARSRRCAPMEYSLLTERRRRRAARARPAAPPGAPGRNLLRAGRTARRRSCPRKAQGGSRPGDALRIETPGGGGHGARRRLTDVDERQRASARPARAA